MVAKNTEIRSLYNAVRAYLGSKADPLVQRMAHHLPRSPRPRELPPRSYPVTDHFGALGRTRDCRSDPILEALAKGEPFLHWGQSYNEADFGRRFLDNYAYMEILGTRGHLRSDKIATGLLMLGPHTDYPAHRHIAEELYVVVAGNAGWRRGTPDYVSRPPGAVIHHPSQAVHAIRTTTEALLVLYIWWGGALAQKSEISEGWKT
jgi:hypothetical protein